MTFDELNRILKTRTVGIAGCGGLGSNCAVALVRVGIGRLVIADYDVVSEGNLNRQYFFLDQIGRFKTEALRENLMRINPGIHVEIHTVKLDSSNLPGIFKSCDVLVEAFDLADQKEMLMETALKVFPEKPVVAGLGVAGWGRSNQVHVVKLGNLYLCGDGVSEISDELLPLAPRVGMVANMQANTVMEILLNNADYIK